MTNTLLINGFKIDIRIYLFVVSYNPLFVVYHRGGILKNAKNKFNISNLDDICRVKIQSVGLFLFMADTPSANYQGIEK